MQQADAIVNTVMYLLQKIYKQGHNTNDSNIQKQKAPSTNAHQGVYDIGLSHILQIEVCSYLWHIFHNLRINEGNMRVMMYEHQYLLLRIHHGR